MDGLVRAALTLKNFGARISGSALAVGFAAYLVARSRLGLGILVDACVAAAFLISLAKRIGARFDGERGPRTGWRDWELFSHLVVGAYALLLALPAHWEGPAYPVMYVLMLLVAAYAEPRAALATLGFAVSVELALGGWTLGRSLSETLAHLAFLGIFAGVNLATFRAELARIRRVSRERVEAELQRIEQAARSYRLLGAPSRATELGLSTTPTPPGQDAQRLLGSSIEEIHLTLQFALDLLRRALNLRSAALLWLESNGTLVTREVSTSLNEIPKGPFPTSTGVLAAAIMGGREACLTGAQAARAALLAPEAVAVTGMIAATPLLEHGALRGVLLVDREANTGLSVTERELMIAIGRFVLRAIQNEQIFVQLERAKVEQGKLYRAVNCLSEAKSEAQVIKAGVSSAREFTSFQFAAVTLYDKRTDTHEICAISGSAGEPLVGKSFVHNTGLVSMVVENRHPLPYRGHYDPRHQIVFSRSLTPPAYPSLLVLPLEVHQEVLGTIVLGSEQPSAFADSVRQALEVLARHIAVSLDNARLLARLEELATIDGLTGLLNKRSFIDVARQKLRSAQRFSKPLSLIVCDIDHFKQVNDTYGHDCGDLVIRGLADLLRRLKRETDDVGRFGGEEFVIVCEETTAEGARLLGERLRTELRGTVFHTEQGALRVSCSVGVAQYGDAGRDWETLFKATDEALYRAKRQGRDQVTVWSPAVRGAA